MEEHTQQLTPVATSLIDAYISKETPNHDSKISVNRFVSEIASWYEKLRNSMDIRDDEIVLRAAIERILKRRLLLGGTGTKIAEPLVRELLWAKYFPDNSISESTIHQVADIIDIYLDLKIRVIQQNNFSENVLNEWVRQLISCQLAKFLNPKIEKELMSNFVFHILKNRLQIVDDNEDNKNIQMFIAVRRAFAKDDIAFLRYYLFRQLFGEINRENVGEIAEHFKSGYEEIERQLHYPIKEKVYLYVKRQTPVFFIMEDVFTKYKGNLLSFVQNKEEFEKAIFTACETKYKGISSKVRAAIIKSVFFLLLTKAVIAYGVEYVYGLIRQEALNMPQLIVNIVSPPLIMIIVSLFIRPPSQENSKRILKRINSLLYDEYPDLGQSPKLRLHPEKKMTILNTTFTLLWMVGFVISFGFVIYLLSRFGFNLLNQGLFIFFLTIVAFLAYRINLSANMYKIEEKQGLFTPIIDFFFLPIIRVGMRLTDGISQINILIFVFDFLIEAPFKSIFSFIEKWFVYLHTKREDLG
ncbi:MAG TPA: hypothetical protein VLG12_00385 [Candidatus Saccharimonadales bacterium]|nr:hypothetical protein [Candidatus Saccharimonadales bacterium]